MTDKPIPLSMDEQIEVATGAIADPGKYLGFRGDEGMTRWQARAVIAALSQSPNNQVERWLDWADDVELPNGEPSPKVDVEAVAELESALCAPTWPRCLQHVHSAIAALKASQ